jgi:hypothetical protein
MRPSGSNVLLTSKQRGKSDNKENLGKVRNCRRKLGNTVEKGKLRGI